MKTKFYTTLIIMGILLGIHLPMIAEANESPQQVYKKYITAVRSKNPENIMKYLSKSGMSKLSALPYEERANEIEQMNWNIYDNYEEDKLDMDDKRAVLHLKAKTKHPVTGNMKTISGKVHFEKEDNIWKVEKINWDS